MMAFEAAITVISDSAKKQCESTVAMYQMLHTATVFCSNKSMTWQITQKPAAATTVKHKIQRSKYFKTFKMNSLEAINSRLENLKCVQESEACGRDD